MKEKRDDIDNSIDEEQLTEIERMRNPRRKKGRAERIWKPWRLRFNDNYRYVSKNPGLAFLYYFAVFVGMPFVYLYYKVKYDFRVIDKKNVKALKKRSAVTVANHVHDVDAMMLSYVFYPSFPYFIARRHNFEAFVLGGLVRVLRGVPLPEDTRHLERFTEQINDVLQRTRRKVHMFPEGEIEAYAKELRPFKNGAFHFAVKNNAPVLPMVFVFPGGRKIHLIVGKPVMLEDVPGASGVKEPKQVIMMNKYVHQTMQDTMNSYYEELEKK
ncbi:MAG: lysophospholipid acyltransferase family protein [Christensenellaceae bacterium]|jgi:1-acyl-sn-glycerol-3-phosphate acyltransferase